MPYTFAHPAAVLPLRRWCPKYLIFEALVCGTLAPDFLYFTHSWQLSAFAHTLPGSFVIDIPITVFLMSVLYACKRYVARLLPSPHCELLTKRTGLGSWNLRTYLKVCLSGVLGAWTHIIWDGFTHSSGWCIPFAPILSYQVKVTNDFSLPIYHLLQYVSSIVGIAIVALEYTQSIRKFKSTEETFSDRTKVKRLIVLFFLAGLISALLNYLPTNTGSVQHLAFLLLVNWTGIFILLLLISAVALGTIEDLRGKKRAK